MNWWERRGGGGTVGGWPGCVARRGCRGWSAGLRGAARAPWVVGRAAWRGGGAVVVGRAAWRGGGAVGGWPGCLARWGCCRRWLAGCDGGAVRCGPVREMAILGELS